MREGFFRVQPRNTRPDRRDEMTQTTEPPASIATPLGTVATPVSPYDPHAAQDRWLPVWESLDLYRAGRPGDGRPKRYILDMFPYPSGDLHMGHAEAFSVGDVVARYWMQHVVPVLHPVARHHVADGERLGVAHVQVAGGVREHVEDVTLGASVTWPARAVEVERLPHRQPAVLGGVRVVGRHRGRDGPEWRGDRRGWLGGLGHLVPSVRSGVSRLDTKKPLTHGGVAAPWSSLSAARSAEVVRGGARNDATARWPGGEAARLRRIVPCPGAGVSGRGCSRTPARSGYRRRSRRRTSRGCAASASG